MTWLLYVFFTYFFGKLFWAKKLFNPFFHKMYFFLLLIKDAKYHIEMQKLFLFVYSYFWKLYFNIIFSTPNWIGMWVCVCESFHLTVISKLSFFYIIFCTHFFIFFCLFMLIFYQHPLLVPLKCWVCVCFSFFIYIAMMNTRMLMITALFAYIFHFCLCFYFFKLFLIYWISLSFMNDLNKWNFSSIFLFCFCFVKYLLPCYGIIYYISRSLLCFYAFLYVVWFLCFFFVEIILQFVWMMAIINYLIIHCVSEIER